MANRMSWIALVTACLLSAWVFAEWRAEPRPSVGAGNEPIEPTSSEAQIPEPTTEFTPVSEFKGTLTRPLFIKGRRQEPEASDTEGPGTANAAPSAPPPNMKLSAIIITDSERSALLMPTGESQSERVKEGETVSGWEVLKINDDSVVIRSRGQEQTLTLRDFGPPGAVPRRPATPGGQPGNPKATRNQSAEQLKALRKRAAERAKPRARSR